MEHTKEKTIRLLRQGQKGILRAVFSRTGIVTLLLLIQIVLMMGLFLRFQQFLAHYVGLYLVVIVTMVRFLFNSDDDPTVKLTWLVLFAVLPIAGSLFYLFTKSEVGHRALRYRLEILSRQEHRWPQQTSAAPALAQENPRAAAMASYVCANGGYPVWTDTDVTYFPLGEEKFQALKEALEQAERFIFLEYYIVDEGEMWGQILEILARKAAQGVDVRVMYDGTCEFYLLPRNYPEKLKALGIQCRGFSPVKPFLSTHYNYRDHRKILVIDGHTAFTGGVNLADEYINQGSKYGHWKDVAVMLRGPAAASFTRMFLQMWAVGGGGPEYEKFWNLPAKGPEQARGFVMPYGDSPLDKARVGEQVYMDILNRAERYVHIMTPYLILDGELEHALCYCAQRGVEVQLILPGIPDKKMPYALAKTHFPTLTAAGVEIWLYDPGFVHAKSFVCDDREAVVGTINLDYRSLYHHFECAAWMYGVEAIGDMERDFQNTLAQCSRVTPETIKNEPWRTRWLGRALKFLAPLL